MVCWWAVACDILCLIIACLLYALLARGPHHVQERVSPNKRRRVGQHAHLPAHHLCFAGTSPGLGSSNPIFLPSRYLASHMPGYSQGHSYCFQPRNSCKVIRSANDLANDPACAIDPTNSLAIRLLLSCCTTAKQQTSRTCPQAEQQIASHATQRGMHCGTQVWTQGWMHGGMHRACTSAYILQMTLRLRLRSAY